MGKEKPKHKVKKKSNKVIKEISLDKPIFKIMEEYCQDINLPSFFVGLNEGRILNSLEHLGDDKSKILVQTVTQAYLFAGINFAIKHPNLVNIKYGKQLSTKEELDINEETKINIQQYVG